MSRRILYVQYTNPAAYPPLQHSSRIFADAGSEVLFLGAGAFGSGELVFPPHPRIAVRQLRYCEPGFRQKLHFVWYCLWVIIWTLRWRPHWIYASDWLSCPSALAISALLRRRMIYHEHDEPGESGRERSAFFRFCMWTRRMCARRAEICIVPNSRRAQRLESESGRKTPVAVVWNCPSSGEVPPVPRAGIAEVFRLLYHGSVVPERLPLTVIDALAKLPASVLLRIVGYETKGSKGYLHAIERRAAELGVGGRVVIHGALPARAQILAICGACDVGLALMPMSSSDGNLLAMTGASNKPFDYLSCGLPVLVSDLPDWRAMFVDTGLGFACDPSDPDSLAATVRRFAGNSAETRSMGELGRQRVLKDWNYEVQFRGVMASMEADPGGAGQTVVESTWR